MTNLTFGAVGVGILSVGVVAVSLKVAFTYLKPQFDRNFRHLEFANGTIFTQTELNTQMLTQLGREVGRIQDTISVLIGQLEEVKSTFDLNDPEFARSPSSSSSFYADSPRTPRTPRTPRSSRPVVVEDASEEEEEEEEESEEEIISPSQQASTSASASASASFDPSAEEPLPPLPTLNIFTSRSPSSSREKGKGRLVPRGSSSTALTSFTTDNSDRIFKQFQMAQENISTQVAKRYEDFEALERRQSQPTTPTYAPSTSEILSSMAKGLSSTVSSTVASVSSGAPAGSQTGLVNNQYYGLIHIHGTPAVPDFLNIGKYLTSFVRTGLFSVFQSIII